MAAHRSGIGVGWLPIVERELRVSARQKLLLWGRLLSVGLALLVFAL
ncbi:MAG: hypothetical protein K0Q55_3996, partial [Verrucomicrobia bacterium]|nr:hypothetical protein [Verrucomicrobiota bacterium]